MFDFRYHALSLVAVFLALAIGILLGASIGVAPVEEADTRLRSNLQADVQNARESSREAQAEADARERLIEATFPMLAGGRLNGRDVAIVSAGDLPDELDQAVREAVDVAAGAVDSVSVVRLPDDAAVLARAAGGPYAGVSSDDSALEGLARAMGGSLVRGGSLAERLQAALPERFGGALGGADAVIFYRAPPEPSPQRPAAYLARREALERSLVEGLEDTGVPVVAIEGTTTRPSQVPLLRRHGARERGQPGRGRGSAGPRPRARRR